MTVTEIYEFSAKSLRARLVRIAEILPSATMNRTRRRLALDSTATENRPVVGLTPRAVMADSPDSDRKRVVKTTLQEQGDDVLIVNATPAERIGMVWQLTLDAWAFMDPASAKSEFQRHAVRVERGGR